MQISIDDPELDKDAQKVAAAWGRPLEEMMRVALRQTIQRLRAEAPRKIDWDAVRKIQNEVARLPILDTRSDEELLGYNEFGHFD
jgi:antitoxin VapB